MGRLYPGHVVPQERSLSVRGVEVFKQITALFCLASGWLVVSMIRITMYGTIYVQFRRVPFFIRSLRLVSGFVLFL